MSLLANPWLLLGAAVAWALSIGGGFWAGHQVTHNAWMAEQAAIERVAAETWRADAIKLNQLARAHVAEEQEKERVVYQPIFRTLTKVVEKPVYRDRACALDADGLQLLNAAIAGAAAAGREPDGAVRAGGASGGADAGTAAAEGGRARPAPQSLR